MAEPKTIICVCHDVTERDLVDAFAAGHTHPETLKRATGCFMGPCQGRYCASGFAEVYERLGSFYGTDFGEDWEMWVRIARYYPVAYTPALLAEYRGRTTSVSAEKERLGHIMTGASHAIGLIQQHLPAADKQRIAQRSRKRYAYLGIGGATFEGTVRRISIVTDR